MGHRVVGGKIHSFSDNTNCLKLTSEDVPFCDVWEQEEDADLPLTFSKEDKYALELFCDTTIRAESARYIVQLPKKELIMFLGESRSFALKRYYQNKRSLTHKGQWTPFHKGLGEYRVIGHAELVPIPELSSSSCLTRFLCEDFSGNLEEWRMCRVTLASLALPF